MNRDEVLSLYQSYLELLERYIDEQGYFTWLKPDDLDYIPEYKKTEWHLYDIDNFVMEAASDKTILAKDIIEHGMYWPLFIAENPHYEKPVVLLGYHRIYALKEYYGRNPDEEQKELLCIGLNRNHFYEDITERMPFNRNPATCNRLERPFVCLIPRDGMLVQEIIQDYGTLLETLKSYSRVLNDYFYIWKDTPDRIPASEIINDKHAFKDWRNMRGVR